MLFPKNDRSISLGILYETHTNLGLDTYGVPPNFLTNKTTLMKTLKYIILAILLGINLVSCTVDDSILENETIEVVETEELEANNKEIELDDDEE